MDGTGCAPSDVAVRWAAGREQGMSAVMAAEQGGLQWGLTGREAGAGWWYIDVERMEEAHSAAASSSAGA
jgi:hypothetical protein